MIKKNHQLIFALGINLLLSLFVYSSEIEIDGELEENLWRSAYQFKTFKVSQPLTFAEPDHETEVFVTSTSDGIYIGFVNEQEVDESKTSKSLRDADITTDYNEVIIDFDAQSIRGFGFKVSRTGSVQDAIWTDENRESVDWDGDWQVAVEVDDDEWVVEIFIPWSIVTMRADEDEKRNINMYFARWHQGKGMRYSYPAIDRSQKSFLSKFHHLELAAGENTSLDVFPYISYNSDREIDKSETRAGVDLFWKPTTSQQLNLTFNPDFGQVEADDLIVNFSAVETFFSEKRPFFRENHDLFDLQGPQNLRLVHTPRIGGESDVEDAPSNTIDAAARYNYTGDTFDFGLLSAIEDDNQFSLGRDFLAIRGHLKLDSGQIGILHTHTEKKGLNRESKVNVLDFQLDPLEDLRLEGQIIETKITQTNVHTNGDAWWISAEWEPSDELSHQIYVYDYGNNFDISDFGFVERVNLKQIAYEGSYQWTDFESSLRDIELEWYFENKENHHNVELPAYYELEALLTFEDTQALEIEIEYLESGIDDILTRGNNPVDFPVSNKTSIKYISNQNQDLSFEVSLGKGKEFLSGELLEFEFIPTWQITDTTDLSVAFELEDADSWVIWDEDNELEEFKREEFTLSINFNAVFEEKHELRIKLESVALEAVAKNEFEAQLNGQLVINDEPPDSFSLSEFAAQIRYRYEISALSELFVVYSRGGEFEEETLGFSRTSLMRKGFEFDDSENVFIKLKLHF